MDEFRIGYREALIYLSVANAVLGVLFGCFPLFTGLKLRNARYGIIGFVGSVLGGALAGIFLSFPVAFIFVWLILRKSPENSVDVPTEISQIQ